MKPELRVLLGVAGALLLVWVITKLRRRTLRVSLGGLFVALALFFGITAALPKAFDFVSRALGIPYPPIFFFMAAITLLFVIVGELAGQASKMDMRIRVMASGLACLKARVEALQPGEKPEQKPAGAAAKEGGDAPSGAVRTSGGNKPS